jgi:hypothetical protein
VSATRWLSLAGVVAWGSSVLAWIISIVVQQFDPIPTWLYDWHVYAAAATALLEGTLYFEPLESAFPLPVVIFNYPPLSALIVTPLLLLPDQVAGTLWVVSNIAAMGAAAVLVARILRLSNGVAWAGIGFFVFTFNPWAWLALLGNNTPLVLLLVVAFAHYHVAGHRGRAGVLLGLAIGLKLWPASLLPLLFRERRWHSLLWAVGISAAVVVATVAWLGPDVIGPAADSMRARDDIKPTNPVFGITWLRENIDWWPSWGGYAIAALLVLIPARGGLGLGLGILAGMAAVPNLWRHYLPTVAVGILLLAFGIRDARHDREGRASSAPARAVDEPRSPDPESRHQGIGQVVEVQRR